MQKKESPTFNKYSRYVANYSLSQIYFFATFVILLFTFLFAFLLIQDENQSYEKQLQAEYALEKSRTEGSLIHAANQIATVMNYEYKYPSKRTPNTLKKVPELFLDSQKSLVELYDNQLKPQLKLPYNKIDMRRYIPTENASLHRFSLGKKDQELLSYKVLLANGYCLLVAKYVKPESLLLQERRARQKSKIIKNILEITTLAFLLFGIIFGINKIISAIMQRDIDTFLQFFERAAHHDQVIIQDQILLREFRVMVKYANEMVDTIMQQKYSLTELNRSLEQKVATKTKALQQHVDDLAKAEQFSQKLLDSQKTFLRHAIHETNTPLSVIVTSIDLYVMQHGKNRQLSKIDAAVKNIFNIYDDLSYLVKKDQVEYPKVAIDFNVYLRSRVDFFDEVALESRLKFELNLCEEERFIYFNETKLQRIIDNNITNAIKFTVVGETINIETRVVDSKIRFAIFSHSKKIDDTNKVLEPYYREDGRLEGFGLGLNLVKSICDEENVEISIVSIEQETRFSYLFETMLR